jgi:hypothetical protein
MSGALVWTDETNASGEMLDALRLLFHCRTQILMQAKQCEWLDYWNAAREIVPNWIGFHHSRCTPNNKLLKLIEDGEKRLETDLAEIERESDLNAG